MTRYHISKESGRPNICRAEKQCPLTDEQGNPAPHFSSKEEAREYFEGSQDHKKFSSGVSKKSNKNVSENGTKKRRGRPRKNAVAEEISVASMIENFQEDFDNDDLDTINPDIEDLDFNEDELYEDPIIDDYDDESFRASDNECDQCGEVDFSVRLRIDPYELEQYGEEKWRPLCDDCYEELKSF